MLQSYKTLTKEKRQTRGKATALHRQGSGRSLALTPHARPGAVDRYDETNNRRKTYRKKEGPAKAHALMPAKGPGDSETDYKIYQGRNEQCGLA